MHGPAGSNLRFPPWGVAAAELGLQLAAGTVPLLQHGVPAHRRGSLSGCSGHPSPPRSQALLQPGACTLRRNLPHVRIPPGDDIKVRMGKPGGICRALRASRAGRLETIQFSRRCSQGHE